MKRTVKRTKPDEDGPFEMGGMEYDVITHDGELHILCPEGAIIIKLEDLNA